MTRQADIQTCPQVDIQTCQHTNTHTGIQTFYLAYIQTHRHKEGLTQTDKQADRRKKHTNVVIYGNVKIMPLDGRLFHLFKPKKGLTYYPNFISIEEKGAEIY